MLQRRGRRIKVCHFFAARHFFQRARCAAVIFLREDAGIVLRSFFSVKPPKALMAASKANCGPGLHTHPRDLSLAGEARRNRR
jgi:hypothetical protein